MAQHLIVRTLYYVQAGIEVREGQLSRSHPPPEGEERNQRPTSPTIGIVHSRP